MICAVGPCKSGAALETYPKKKAYRIFSTVEKIRYAFYTVLILSEFFEDRYYEILPASMETTASAMRIVEARWDTSRIVLSSR